VASGGGGGGKSIEIQVKEEELSSQGKWKKITHFYSWLMWNVVFIMICYGFIYSKNY
jgi:hypothetical protein